MSWSTPKTDWNGETVDGVYTGDRFNAVDFNRIKNNLEYLRELAIKMYDEFAIQSVGSDKTVKSWFKNHYKIMSKKQRSNMDTLFNQLKEVTKCTLSPLPMAKS